MNLRWLILLPLILTACNDKNPSPPPGGGGDFQPPPASNWTFFAGSKSGPCAEFDFPQSGSGAGYCYKSASVAVGQRITLSFTLSGPGSLAPTSDSPPATLSLMLWRKGDDGSCQGAQQQSRIFYPQKFALSSMGSFTVSAPIVADQWTDCYGQPVNAANLASVVNNLFAVAYTFGGRDFAGHGVIATSGSVHFKLDGFGVN